MPRNIWQHLACWVPRHNLLASPTWLVSCPEWQQAHGFFSYQSLTFWHFSFRTCTDLSMLDSACMLDSGQGHHSTSSGQTLLGWKKLPPMCQHAAWFIHYLTKDLEGGFLEECVFESNPFIAHFPWHLAQAIPKWMICLIWVKTARRLVSNSAT